MRRLQPKTELQKRRSVHVSLSLSEVQGLEESALKNDKPFSEYLRQLVIDGKHFRELNRE